MVERTSVIFSDFLINIISWVCYTKTVVTLSLYICFLFHLFLKDSLSCPRNCTDATYVLVTVLYECHVNS
jgi:hypothetical protein